jgi:hypothetical protein
MIKITEEQRSLFFLNGWVQVPLGLSSEAVKKAYSSLVELENTAKEIEFPLGRIYYPHLTEVNQAAIEAPFNKLIFNKCLMDLFGEIQVGAAVRTLMNWDESYCQLARLFTMANYKYKGQWHRDFTGWNGDIENSSSVQVGIYLKDQEGFRIIKRDLDITGMSDDRLREDFKYGSTTLPFDLKKDYYDTIRGEAGTLLFFIPGLLHQGCSRGKRLDFHLRFSNSPKLVTNNELVKYVQNEFQDFYIRDIYSYDAEPGVDVVSPRVSTPRIKDRLINTVNYNTAIVNLFRILKSSLAKDKLVSEPWSYDPLANTIFQKV